MFIKANALKSNAAHFQRKDELGNSHAKAGGSAIHIASKVAALGPKLKHAAKQGVEHKDAELVLYEFVELIVRIAFQRANPNFGQVLPPRATPSPDKGGAAIAASDLPSTLVPLPDCLHTMLHKVLLPRAKRDQTQVFRERLVQDQSMQAVLALYETDCASGSTSTHSYWQTRAGRALYSISSGRTCSSTVVVATSIARWRRLASLQAIWWVIGRYIGTRKSQVMRGARRCSR